MRRMLDPTKVGGLPSTIEFDKDGNREVKKNLKVDGKLTLPSLVSDTNPDGDITKELGGGGKIYLHSIHIYSSEYDLYINIYSTSNTKLTFQDFEQLVHHYGKVICTGFYTTSTVVGIMDYVEYNSSYQGIKIYYFNLQSKTEDSSGTSSANFIDKVAEVI